MNKLRELQEQFESYLLNDDPTIFSQVAEPRIGERDERLAIYANGYRSRLLEALSKNYTLLEAYMGQEKFLTLGERYLDAYPSHHFSIAKFGHLLPEFLAKKPYAQKVHLSELADFIRAMHNCFETPNAAPVTQKDLACIPQDDWPYLHFKFHTSVRLVHYQWNVTDIWQALALKKKPPKLSCKKPVDCVIWRKINEQGMHAYYKKLPVKETWMLKALQDDQSFAELCEGLTQWLAPEKIPEYALHFLLRCFNDEMIIAIDVCKP